MGSSTQGCAARFVMLWWYDEGGDNHHLLPPWYNDDRDQARKIDLGAVGSTLGLSWAHIGLVMLVGTSATTLGCMWTTIRHIGVHVDNCATILGYMWTTVQPHWGACGQLCHHIGVVDLGYVNNCCAHWGGKEIYNPLEFCPSPSTSQHKT